MMPSSAVGNFLFGATEAAAFEADGQWYLAVANSLSRQLRFRDDTVIYRLNL